MHARHINELLRTTVAMTRRLMRTGSQFIILSLLALLFVFFLDSRYRVLPNAIHSRLPQHHVGQVITDITLTSCTKISLLSGCNLDSSWTNIPKDVYLEEH